MIGIGILVTAVGFILALAVHPTNPGSVNVNTIGWILVVVGLLTIVIDAVLRSGAGFGYRRRTYVAQQPGYSGYGYRGWGRRQVIEEEDVPPPGPGY